MGRQWTIEESVVIDAEPERVYAAVADPRRMGEWSPEVFAVRVRGRRVVPGLAFVGFNRVGARVWFTNCRVTEAVPGRAFAFRVTTFGIPVAVWGYRVEPAGDGSTRLTERWEDLRRAGRGAAFASLLGRVFTGVPADGRAEVNRQGMRTTLARIKAALEVS
ncbi:SRPBCC family protein [Actinoallomurus spadix]|uniref:SRPBCC family protein n=1 Tax=Actinoallomurus spadix TaxID=79912 RepID=A0ABN0XQQ6_9ACTN|nr:SRPBCC family protein [Actinoallomurus spadix]MCO5988307.1 SRPBCC family protein [Actinoallomurus spadix]